MRLGGVFGGGSFGSSYTNIKWDASNPSRFWWKIWHRKILEFSFFKTKILRCHFGTLGTLYSIIHIYMAKMNCRTAKLPNSFGTSALNFCYFCMDLKIKRPKRPKRPTTSFLLYLQYKLYKYITFYNKLIKNNGTLLGRFGTDGTLL